MFVRTMALNNNPIPIPVYKRVLRLVFSLLKYPFRIKKKYDYYIAIISLMDTKVKDLELKDLKKRMLTILRLLIMMPMFLGVTINLVQLSRLEDPYLSGRNKYIVFIERSIAPLHSQGFFDTSLKVMKRGYLIFIKNPINLKDFMPFLMGYGLAIVGALFAAKNPLFEKSDLIEEYLQDMKMTDINKNPWKVVYTPKYIFFEAYGHDHNRFVEKTSFWNNLGDFLPGDPIQFSDDSTRFIIPKKYSLPEKIELVFNAQVHQKEEGQDHGKS